MNSQLFIPKKCKVGFDLRSDTYTGRLGYVIAFDGKKWRKETSWEGWRKKVGDKKYGSENINGKWVEKTGVYGEEVKPIEFDNVPTSGFVLNKKVGGYKSSWNHRQTYSRVFDPRGFEFEINISNLLYILEHSNSIKGKGLEGEFIYSWDGKDLVLLPSGSPEFETAVNYTQLQTKKISTKDLVPGCVYKTKKEENVVYIGRYTWYSIDKEGYRKGTLKHIFYSYPINVNSNYSWEKEGNFLIKNDLSFLALKVSNEIVSDFSTIFDKFKKKQQTKDIKQFIFEPCELNLELVKKNNISSRNYLFIFEGGEAKGISLSWYENTNWEKECYYRVQKILSIEPKTKKILREPYRYYNYYSIKNENTLIFTEENIKFVKFFNLQIELETGELIKLDDMIL